MQFKKITAVFRVKSDAYDYEFTLKREVSGAFAYGNRSAHYLVIRKFGEQKVLRDDLYDTRYTTIPTDKKYWVEFWTKYIRKNWMLNPTVTLISYEESEETI